MSDSPELGHVPSLPSIQIAGQRPYCTGMRLREMTAMEPALKVWFEVKRTEGRPSGVLVVKSRPILADDV